jgi:hypothetical protein
MKHVCPRLSIDNNIILISFFSLLASFLLLHFLASSEACDCSMAI